MAEVLIVMGSDSDLPILQGCLETLADFKIDYDVRISSAHRAPRQTQILASEAEQNGYQVIIAAAGLAAHLPGVIAASTELPVIGLPIDSGSLHGLDALYAIVQMPSGIPVATVGINNAKNAALLAAQILALKDAALRQRLREHKHAMTDAVIAKDQRLQQRLAQHDQ